MMLRNLSRMVFRHKFSYNSQPFVQAQFVRCKYYETTGVKGFKGRKVNNYNQPEDVENEDVGTNSTVFDYSEYDIIANHMMNTTRNILNIQNVIVLQPYVKWGARKSATKPELALQEAEALVRSIPTWTVEHSVKVPLESLEKQSVFGKGKLAELKSLIQELRRSGKRITCVFVSKSTLTLNQKQNLESSFGVPVIDRYSIVIQIMRLHATSMEAKLQVAMAELPYIRSQTEEINNLTVKNIRFSFTDEQRQVLKDREKKLKNELIRVRGHRELLRSKRKKENIPIVAVVGYTNAGKTSLIKALTNEQRLEPKDQLFATLDVTAHTGMTPSNLKVIFMDTVGFMSEIPTGLIECFIATLEDAMLADLIIHVHDVSHENYPEQRKHVEQTLRSLLQNSNNADGERLFNNIVNVGNKCDLVNLDDIKQWTVSENLHLISSKTLVGIGDLMDVVEKQILLTTNRKKITIRVPMGGAESAWLYKNSAVTEFVGDPENQQKCLMTVIISEAKLQQFRHIFVNK
ncbi:putative GTP-binding protein 6 [Pseudolycoriella hygida]|uniref:GTP-binding protein 6 n=2 Tax=Pseudolycoriella hygida TaxID=35572 RepID=A0A9Q0MI45_9DIPT|nr:putative GTP-binding protein 6 [Pseudolycoriella hygida]